MKTLVILNAVSLAPYACERVFGGKSAVERCFEWAQSVPDFGEAAVLVPEQSECSAHVAAAAAACGFSVKTVQNDAWTVSVLFARLNALCAGFDTLVYAYADCPFYDTGITRKLYENQKKYAAEYCFADGYPYGIAPEILDCGLVSILASLCATQPEVAAAPVARDSVFSLMKTDINSFEIETVIAPRDYRYLRYRFSAGTKRDMLLCRRLYEKAGGAVSCGDSGHDICRLAEADPGCLRTLPAYYEIQLASFCGGTCAMCPYPAAYRKKYGHGPETAQAQNSADTMPFERFSALIDGIARFSDDAVVSLSAWGDPLSHPDIVRCISDVLRYPALSLVIETDGSLLTPELAAEISGVCKNAAARTNGQPPLIWIVSIDAADETVYRAMHGNSAMTFEKARAVATMLLRLFPGCVYPQFVRTTENEAQLETFYRYWRSLAVSTDGTVSADGKNGALIIQKYNSFSGLLPDRKVADLSPVQRTPCWHLRRDMVILADGTVPLCKNAVLDGFCGNVFEDSLENIWQKAAPVLEEQVKKVYTGICRDCDEYYTFNF